MIRARNLALAPRAVLAPLAAALLVLLLAPAAPRAADAASIPFEKYALPNGLRVILHQDRTSPIVGVHVQYDVGSKDEKPGRTGFAHLFEHLMFQGSQHFPKGEADRLIAAAGGETNGGTSQDSTVYWQLVPSNALEQALWIESDRMGFLLATLTQENLDNQRDVVRNERRENFEMRPYGLVFDRLLAALWNPEFPYHWLPIGSHEDLQAATLEDVKEFHARWYGPENAILSIAGDIDVPATKAMVARWFGGIPGKARPVHERPAPRPLEREVRIAMEDQVQLPRVYVAWQSPAAFAPGDAALDVLGSILSSGKSARLTERFELRERTAQGVSAGQSGDLLAGMFLVVATPKPGVDPEELLAGIDEELARIQAAPPSEEELARAKNKIESGAVFALERVGGFGGRAAVLADYEMMVGDPGYLDEDLARYRAVTAAEVSEAARRFLRKDARVVLTVSPRQGERPQPAPPPLAPSVAPPEAAQSRGTPTPDPAAQSRGAPTPDPAAQAPGAAPDRSVAPPLGPPPELRLPPQRKFTLPNGLRVRLVEYRRLPLVAVNLLVDAGAARDPQPLPGLASFTAAMLTEGTTTRSAIQLSDELGLLGASLGAGASQDAAQLSGAALSRHLPKLLELLADVAIRPAFPPADLERVRDARRVALLQQRDQPQTIAGKAFVGLFWGERHPYGHFLTGDEASVAATRREDLVRFHARHYAPASAELVVVGDVDEPTLRKLLAPTLGAWRGGPRAPRLAPAAPAAPRRALLLARPESPQTYVQLGTPGLRRSAPEFVASTVAFEILGGGMSSRLMRNLREEKGWTYGVSAMGISRRLAGASLVAGSFKAEETGAALAEILREIARLRKEPVPAQELADARSALVLSLPGDFATAGSIAGRLADLALHGLPDDYWNRYADLVRAVTPAELGRVVNRVLDPARMTVVMVGDADAVRPQLGKLDLGPVEVRATPPGAPAGPVRPATGGGQLRPAPPPPMPPPAPAPGAQPATR